MILFFIAYIVIMKYILPKAGIPTWMSGACDIQDESQKNIKTDKEEVD